MQTLIFRTNNDCPFRLQKAVCGLECLRGKYCRFSVDLMEINHTLTIRTDQLKHEDVINAFARAGVFCEKLLAVMPDSQKLQSIFFLRR